MGILLEFLCRKALHPPYDGGFTWISLLKSPSSTLVMGVLPGFHYGKALHRPCDEDFTWISLRKNT
ncbi:hypothetical protein C4588_04395 [Candidatus Parcubacteria bacterium]|nr:MAG: hypothetical protein C4588_04395 [Candidatus Parcubacteria bacterium]